MEQIKRGGRGNCHRRKYVNMKRSVKLKHCFGGEETQETTRSKKQQGGFSVLLRKEEEIT